MASGSLHVSEIGRQSAPVPGPPINRPWWKLPAGVLRQFLRWAALLALLVLGQFSLALALGLLPVGLLAFLFARRIGYQAWVGWPLALAGLLGLQCIVETPPSVRQHDVEGHREYVDFVSEQGGLPPVTEGWETWQPPLYYLLAAVWRWLFSVIPQEDSFRSTQFLAAALYISTVAWALTIFRRLHLDDVEAVAGVGFLALLPGHLFFAARINNDVLLPFLGAGVLLLTARLVENGRAAWTTKQSWGFGWMGSGDSRLWIGLGLLLGASLATKGSSLAVVSGVLGLVFGSEFRHSGRESAIRRTYLTGLPAGLWLLFWCVRNAAQTGDPFYVNANLPDELRVLTPPAARLLSFKIDAFLAGNFYYDEPIRGSYFTALLTSALYGEYNMGGYGFRCPELLRWGSLGLIAILLAGAVIPPRRERRAAWVTCLCLAACQFAITLAYALKFPYACNQNVRFFAQAYVPFAGLFGLGAGHLWRQWGCYGRSALIIIVTVFVVGLVDFYARLLL